MVPRQRKVPWKRLDAALRPLGFASFATSGVTPRGLTNLPNAVQSAERHFTELADDFRWQQIAATLSALAAAVDFVALRVDDKGALDLVFGRAPASLDLVTEQELGSFLKRVLLDMRSAARKFSLSDAATETADGLLTAVGVGEGGRAARVVMPLVRFRETINAVVVVAAPDFPSEFRSEWETTDLTWNLPSSVFGPRIAASLTFWLWSTASDEVVAGGASFFDNKGAWIPNLTNAHALSQNLRFTK